MVMHAGITPYRQHLIYSSTLQKTSAAPQSFDAVRAARMGGYGFCFYGPYQHFWYGLLDKFFPTKSPSHFGTKVRAARALSASCNCVGIQQ